MLHNLDSYDGHHLMTKLGKFKDHQIDVIANTLEKYITFKLHKPNCPVQQVFLDGFQFLTASLEKLLQNLNVDEFHILKEDFPSSADLNLLRRKGIFPYDYITSFEKFKIKYSLHLKPSSTPMRAIYMGGRCPSFYRMEVLNGQTLPNLVKKLS